MFELLVLMGFLSFVDLPGFVIWIVLDLWLVVPPSTQTRVKVPVTLKEKIKECNEPLVGLANVREVLPLSNQEMEPHYYCDLCNQQGQANCMLLHLKLVPAFTLS